MFDVMILAAYIVKDGEKKLFYNKFDVEKLQEIMLESRPSFPSDKITLNIADIIKHRHIRYLTFIFNCTDKFGLETVFEDSKRNSMTKASPLSQRRAGKQRPVVATQQHLCG